MLKITLPLAIVGLMIFAGASIIYGLGADIPEKFVFLAMQVGFGIALLATGIQIISRSLTQPNR